MGDKLIYIPGDDKQNDPFYGLKIIGWSQLIKNEPVKLVTVPKVLEPMNIVI